MEKTKIYHRKLLFQNFLFAGTNVETLCDAALKKMQSISMYYKSFSLTHSLMSLQWILFNSGSFLKVSYARFSLVNTFSSAKV